MNSTALRHRQQAPTLSSAPQRPKLQHPKLQSRDLRRVFVRGSEPTRTPPGDNGSGNSKRQAQQERDVGVGLKAVWYGAEAFGKLLSLGRKDSPASASSPAAAAASPRMTREQILAAIRADYDAQYFVRGVGDMAAYAPDCTFADPFVSFKGTQRFKQNVANLGGLMSDIKIDVYDWKEGESTLDTRWRFSCLLAGLPWQPRLAAAGSTRHVLDLTRGCVVEHVEAWDVEPAKVVAQLFVPAAKVPSNAWETFLLAASAGDCAGMWFVLSPLALRLSAGLVLLSWLSSLLAGPGGEGLLPGPVTVALELLFVGSVVTEVVKFAQGMQGGETGTGGRF